MAAGLTQEALAELAAARVRGNLARAAMLFGAVEAGLDRLGAPLDVAGKLEWERTPPAT